ncbi:MAG: hypothetical protein ABH950_06225 [Candidatus Altiarchaeota archaeon]
MASYKPPGKGPSKGDIVGGRVDAEPSTSVPRVKELGQPFAIDIGRIRASVKDRSRVLRLDETLQQKTFEALVALGTESALKTEINSNPTKDALSAFQCVSNIMERHQKKHPSYPHLTLMLINNMRRALENGRKLPFLIEDMGSKGDATEAALNVPGPFTDIKARLRQLFPETEKHDPEKFRELVKQFKETSGNIVSTNPAKWDYSAGAAFQKLFPLIGKVKSEEGRIEVVRHVRLGLKAGLETEDLFKIVEDSLDQPERTVAEIEGQVFDSVIDATQAKRKINLGENDFPEGVYSALKKLSHNLHPAQKESYKRKMEKLFVYGADKVGRMEALIYLATIVSSERKGLPLSVINDLSDLKVIGKAITILHEHDSKTLVPGNKELTSSEIGVREDIPKIISHSDVYQLRRTAGRIRSVESCEFSPYNTAVKFFSVFQGEGRRLREIQERMFIRDHPDKFWHGVDKETDVFPKDYVTPELGLKNRLQKADFAIGPTKADLRDEVLENLLSLGIPVIGEMKSGIPMRGGDDWSWTLKTDRQTTIIKYVKAKKELRIAQQTGGYDLENRIVNVVEDLGGGKVRCVKDNAFRVDQLKKGLDSDLEVRLLHSISEVAGHGGEDTEIANLEAAKAQGELEVVLKGSEDASIVLNMIDELTDISLGSQLEQHTRMRNNLLVAAERQPLDPSLFGQIREILRLGLSADYEGRMVGQNLLVSQLGVVSASLPENRDTSMGQQRDSIVDSNKVLCLASESIVDFLDLRKKFNNIDPSRPDFEEEFLSFGRFVRTQATAIQKRLSTPLITEDMGDPSKIQSAVDEKEHMAAISGSHVHIARLFLENIESTIIPFLIKTTELMGVNPGASKDFVRVFRPSPDLLDRHGENVGQKGRLLPNNLWERIYPLVRRLAEKPEIDASGGNRLTHLFKVYGSRHLGPLLSGQSEIARLSENPTLIDKLAGLSQEQRIKVVSRAQDGVEVGSILDELDGIKTTTQLEGFLKDVDLLPKRLEKKIQDTLSPDLSKGQLELRKKKAHQLMDIIKNADYFKIEEHHNLEDPEYAKKQLVEIGLKALDEGWNGSFQSVVGDFLDEVGENINPEFRLPVLTSFLIDATHTDEPVKPTLEMMKRSTEELNSTPPKIEEEQLTPFQRMQNQRIEERNLLESILDQEEPFLFFAEAPVDITQADMNQLSLETRRALISVLSSRKRSLTGEEISVSQTAGGASLRKLSKVQALIGDNLPRKLSSPTVLSALAGHRLSDMILPVNSMSKFQENCNDILTAANPQRFFKVVDSLVDDSTQDLSIRAAYLKLAGHATIGEVKAKDSDQTKSYLWKKREKLISEWELRQKAYDSYISYMTLTDVPPTDDVELKKRDGGIYDLTYQIAEESAKGMDANELFERLGFVGKREDTLLERIGKSEDYIFVKREETGYDLEWKRIIQGANGVFDEKREKVGLSDREEHQIQAFTEKVAEIDSCMGDSLPRQRIPEFLSRVYKLSQKDPELAKLYFDTALAPVREKTKSTTAKRRVPPHPFNTFDRFVSDPKTSKDVFDAIEGFGDPALGREYLTMISSIDPKLDAQETRSLYERVFDFKGFVPKLKEAWNKKGDDGSEIGKQAVRAFVSLFSTSEWQENLLAKNTLDVLENNPQAIIDLAETAKKINPTPS